MIRKKLLEAGELHQLRFRLSDALEATDEVISAKFDGRSRAEIRTEIARRSASLIHQARRIWNPAALREALACWRLLKHVEEKAGVRRPGPRELANGGADFIWRRGERLFVAEAKSARSGMSDILTGSDLIAKWAAALQLTVLRLSPGEAIYEGVSFRSPHMDGPCEYNPIFFGDHLSIRDEWRAIAAVLDQLSLSEAQLTDLELLSELTQLIRQQFDLRCRVRIRFVVRTRAGEFVPTLYELVRSYVLITCLCPPVPAANAMPTRMGRLGFRGTNDLHRRRAYRGAKARRMAVWRASRRYRCSAGRSTCPRRGSDVGRHTVRGSAHASSDRKTKAPLLRGRRECVLDFLRVARP
jgi:hypothetical protein